MLILPLILISTKVLGAVEYLSNNEQIRFFFLDPGSVTLEYWVPSQNLESYDWLGFGLQSESSDKADVYFGSKDSALIDGFLSNKNQFPASDQFLGGSSDITSVNLVIDTYNVYSVTRKLITGDIFDVDLVLDTPVVIKTFKGYYDASGEFADGTIEKFEYIVVNNFYLDRKDDFGLYGPWNIKSEGKFKESKRKSLQALLDVP